MLDVVTLGESMLRLSSPASLRLEQTTVLNVDIAGAESNVAIALSRLGLRTGWVSRLTASPLGRMVANKIREHGVDTSRVVWTDEGRVGMYYLELGRAPRPNVVLYDRANSAFSLVSTNELDWDYVADAHVLHLTGITPGLGPNCEALTEHALAVASQADQIISFDLNYRAKIWTPEAAAEALGKLLPQVHILFCGRSEAERIFGIKSPTAEMAEALSKRFGIGLVVVSEGARRALAYNGEHHYQETHRVEIIDPVGAGDAFAAGFLYGYLYDCQPPSQTSPNNEPLGTVQRGLQVGVAMGALTHTHHGDISWCTREDVLNLINDNSPDWR